MRREGFREHLELGQTYQVASLTVNRSAMAKLPRARPAAFKLNAEEEEVKERETAKKDTKKKKASKKEKIRSKSNKASRRRVEKQENRKRKDYRRSFEAG